MNEQKKEPITLTGEQAEFMREMDSIIEEATKRKQKLKDSIEVLKSPRKVNKAFLRNAKAIPKLVARIKKKPLPLQKELQEPILLLMKENGYTDIIENVKAGEFIIQTPKGEKGIILSPDKFTTLKYADSYYKTWIAYENCMSPYPENPIHNAEMYRKTTQKLAMNWRDRDEANIITAKTKMWLYIIGAVVIGLVLLFSTEFGKSLLTSFGKEQAVTVVQTIQQNLSQSGNIGVS